MAAIPTLLGSAGYWIRAIRSRVIQAVSVFSLIRDHSAGFMIGCHACDRHLAVWSEH